jgi:hypothetical protein
MKQKLAIPTLCNYRWITERDDGSEYPHRCVKTEGHDGDHRSRKGYVKPAARNPVILSA